MANILTKNTSAQTSADIVISAATSFSLDGSLDGGDAVEIRKKAASGTYAVMTQRTGYGITIESVLTNTARNIVISPPDSGSITVQVYKPASAVACGVDQD